MKCRHGAMQQGLNVAWRLGCCCLLLLLSGPGSGATTPQATEQQLQALKINIEKLQHWLDGAKGKRSKIQSELKQSEIEIGRIAKKINQVTQDIQAARSKLQLLADEHQQLLLARGKQERYLAAQIRAAYGIGRQEYLKVLLNQEQPEQLARSLRYYDYFNQARAEQIEQYNNTIDQLQQNEAETQHQTSALQQAKLDLEKKRKVLGNSKNKRRQVLVRLEGNIQNKDQQLAKLFADRNQLEQLLNEVEKAIADLQLPDTAAPIRQLKGRLPWPTHGKIVRRFGSIDSASRSPWKGVIIAANEGNQVKAIHHGRVVFADWLRGFGLLIILDHGKGYMSLYGHNQTLYKDLGDWVNPDETIAGVGNSGGRKNTGLYFEIRHDGQPLNPQKWILAQK